ncbi:MAG: SpoIID/LytB domain-containing protein [Lachnospiraceae bacterium]|nr:SpoIID/LytB domain-containing protein [Lachnospiraceae bacterium]
MGYCLDDKYEGDVELNSVNGFSFTADKGSYLREKNIYPTFAKAWNACNIYATGGADAVPVYAGREKWLCYVTSASYNSFSSGAYADNARDFEKISSSAGLVKVVGSDIKFLIDGSISGGFPQFKASEPADGIYSLSLGTRSYRGRIEIGRYNGAATLTAVNIINIESYLLGVVTCEMNNTWGTEALKAQACCSRSYAYVKAGFVADSSLTNPYKIVDTTASQVYKGVGGETKEAYEAVSTTLGKIVSKDGKAVDAFYFSTSGGATDSIVDVWGIKSNVYSGVFDFFEKYPEKKPWVIDYSVGSVSEKLAGAGFDVGKVISVTPLINTRSGRIYSAKVKGTNGTKTITGSKLKSIFGLPDTKCRIIDNSSRADIVTLRGEAGSVQEYLRNCYAITKDGTEQLSQNAGQYILITSDNFFNVPANKPEAGTIRFVGMGWGHGIGMSQSGARGMADAGYSYEQIISFYYNKAEVKSFW